MAGGGGVVGVRGIRRFWLCRDKIFLIPPITRNYIFFALPPPPPHWRLICNQIIIVSRYIILMTTDPLENHVILLKSSRL